MQKAPVSKSEVRNSGRHVLRAILLHLMACEVSLPRFHSPLVGPGTGNGPRELESICSIATSSWDVATASLEESDLLYVVSRAFEPWFLNIATTPHIARRQDSDPTLFVTLSLTLSTLSSPAYSDYCGC